MTQWDPPLLPFPFQTCRTSLVVDWWRVDLPIQGTRAQSLLHEDSTCCGATKPVSTTADPSLKAHAPPQGKPPQWEARVNWRSSPHWSQLEKTRTQQWRPSTAKSKYINGQMFLQSETKMKFIKEKSIMAEHNLQSRSRIPSLSSPQTARFRIKASFLSINTCLSNYWLLNGEQTNLSLGTNGISLFVHHLFLTSHLRR